MSELFSNALKNIFRKGARAVITVVGIAVGVMSVVLVGAMSDTGSAQVAAELDSLGLNGLSVSSKCAKPLKSTDVDIIKTVSGVKSATAYNNANGKITAFDQSSDIMLWGADSVNQVFSLNVMYGQSFSRIQIDEAQSVCMVDKSIAKKLFGRENIVGKTVNILLSGKNLKCTVCAVTSTDSTLLKSVAGDVLPDFVYVPEKVMTRLSGTNTVSSVAVKLDENSDSKTVSRRISQRMDESMGIGNSVKCSDLATQRQRLDNILSIVTVMLSAIGAVSLVVSGLGIMTVMMNSVSERTREIGIKKAIGASFSSILAEFMSEALTISLIGSIIGAVLGVLVLIFGGMIAKIDMVIHIGTLIKAIVSAVVCGLVFGIYPAVKAAKMRPVDALRRE